MSLWVSDFGLTFDGCILLCWHFALQYARADLGLSEGGGKPSSGSLSRGLGAQPPEAIGQLVSEVSIEI